MFNWLKARVDQFRGTTVRSLAIVSDWLTGVLWLIEAKFLPLAREAYAKNEVVYACINLLASSVPEPPLIAYQKIKGEENEALDYEHPLMVLIRSPNELMTEYEFWELTTIYMAIVGRAFWWKRRDNAGRLVALWPLRPDRVGPIYSNSEQPGEVVLSGWSYQQPGRGDFIPVPRRDMLAFNFPDPAGESGGIVEGLGPVQALARQIAADNEATKFVGALLANYAIPGVAIKLKREVRNEAEGLAVKAHFRAEFGGANRGTPALLDAETDLTEIGFNLRELEFPEIREVSESRISSALGVPAVLAGLRIGLKESNTRASLAELREFFAETTLTNYWRRYSDQYTNDIASEFGQGLVCEFDTSKVKALAAQRQQQIAPLVEGWKSGGVMLNEYRAALHLPHLEGGDVRLVPTTMIEVESLTQEAMKALPAGQRLMLLPATKHLAGQHDQSTHGGGGPTYRESLAGMRTKDISHLRTTVGQRSTYADKIIEADVAQLETHYPKKAERLQRAEGNYEEAKSSRPSYAPGPTRQERETETLVRQERNEIRLLAGVLNMKRQDKAIPSPTKFAHEISKADRDWYNSPIGTERGIDAKTAIDVNDGFGTLALKAIDPREEAERSLQRGLEELFGKWAPELAERIRKGEVITDEELADGFRRIIEPELVTAATAEGIRLAAEVGPQFDTAVVNQAAIEWARTYTYDLVRGLTETTRGVLQNAVGKYAETPGMTRGELEKLIEPAFSPQRASVITVTEITRAYSQATNEYQRQLGGMGVTMNRRWHTQADELVCPLCGPLNGQSEKVWREQAPDGPPRHPNCRCTTTLAVASKAVA